MQYKLAEAQSQIMKENEEVSSPIALQSFNSSYIRRNNRREKRLAAELGESLLDSSDVSSDVTSFALDSNIGLKKMPLYTTVANSDKYSKLFKNQFYFSERFLVILLSVVLLTWATLIFIIHMVLLFSADIINPTCQKRCNEQEGIAVRVYVCITIILIIPFGYLLMKMRKINDAFSIRKEMTIMLFFSIFVVAIPMIVLIAVPNQFWPQQPTIGYFLGIELLGSFFISIILPLSSTWTRNMDMSKFNIFRKRNPIPTTKTEQPIIPLYETFEFFLTDVNAREVFKQFLVREFHVESLMFCMEVEHYKGLDIDDDHSLKEVSKNLFDTYIQIGSAFEVNIPGALRDEISKNLAKPNMRTFDKAKEEVIRNMQKGSFVRFKKSSLYENFINKRFGK
ncbi:predicted protein [Naegleria gruberi]|uniref:Predicted protein n=1 Tax=Naegleria gruberi TaxID=5762 RepID=D2V6I4_NAEGR|nr:uncharacterized protein NAEGRDRAFT_64449 [Naegleria gruberi]EFC47579.1 predicted protein [Naegleria gruberi]|eukprot:XP_002680323.1 predicted protein [Naegleria gruberi strain NEG-M]